MSQTEVQLIKDAVIVNADVSNSAAIDVSKISGAMPLAGGSFTDDVTFTGASANIVFDKSDNALEFADSAKATFGADGDLQIYHDGSNSYIKDVGTGDLNIAGSIVRAQSSGGETLFRGVENGVVELYYNNSKKFETTSGGVEVTGNIIPDANNTRNIGNGTTNFNAIWASTRFRGNDNVSLQLGNSVDFKILHDGTTNLIESPTGSDLHIKMMGNTNDVADQVSAKFIEDGAVELYHNGTKKFETASDRVSVTGHMIATGTVKGAKISVDDSSGNGVTIGSSDDLQIYHNGTDSYIDNTNGELFIKTTTKFNLRSDGNEAMIVATPNGAVELKYDNSTKLETTSSGVTVTGRLDTQGLFTGDNTRILVGDGDDLQLLHDGSRSSINNRTGELRLLANNNIRIGYASASNSTGATENYAIFNYNGSNELYFDNSKKFETLTNGVQVTGSAIVDGTGTATTTVTLKNGTDTSGTKLGHSSNSDRGFIQVTESGADFGIQVGGANTSNMRLELFGDTTTASRICLGTEEMIKATPNGAVQLYFDNSAKLQTNSGGADVTGDFGLSGEFNMTAGGNKNRFIDCSLDDGEALFIRSTQGGDANHEAMALFLRNQQVELYYDNVKKLNTSAGGIEIAGTVYFGQGHAVNVMNRESDGTLLEFKTTGTARGSISVSGNTVSYNGGHLSRWSQIKGLSTTDKSARPTLYKGTVLSNLDDLCVWTSKEPEQLNMTKVSDTVGDKDVAGVFLGWDENNSVEVNDLYISMTGDMVIRVAGSTTVARGDLLISAGDGTAKPQADDIVRSSTIAKITSTIPTTTYADGSKAYPCVLMAC